MNRTILILLLMLFAIGINAQTVRTGQKERSAVTTSKGKCGVCKGKGYLVCPTCKGKAVVMKRGDRFEWYAEEFEYLMTVLPIEVKSGKDYTSHKALDKFLADK